MKVVFYPFIIISFFLTILLSLVFTGYFKEEPRGKETLVYKGLEYKAIVSPYTNRVWLDRNLGAKRVCRGLTDEKCYGDYFQWGRAADGHEKSSSKTTDILSENNSPNHSQFIISRSRINKPSQIKKNIDEGIGYLDWKKIRNNNLWQKTSGENNPCPKGFRIPTIDELKDETLNQGIKNSKGIFKNFLKLPLSGYRSSYNGILLNRYSYGSIWSNSFDKKGNLASDAMTLSFYKDLIRNVDSVTVVYSPRAKGNNIRCIEN